MIDLPDEPRWVEAHGIAADPASWRRSLGAGGVVASDAAQLAVVFGEADADAVIALAAEIPHTLLVTTDELAVALRERRVVERAILHTLPEPDALPDFDGATLLGDTPIDHIPFADELRRAGTVWTVFVDGEPVAFASAPWRSRRWFDISFDTLPGARQLGLGTIVAAAMIRDERTRGREPVWGADEGNAASLRLAKRLGFQPVDEIWVASASTAR